ncbi:MAG: septum formation initiator family protein [Microbacteriaceae bacterium]|nr:septum formation initiator family protein [Microbacteriaceae bacterium]
MQRKKPKAREPRIPFQGISWTPSTMVTVGILVFGVFLVGPKLGEYFTMQTQIAQLNANLEKSKNQIKELTDEKKRWDDPVYIRSQARDRLFYVVPGEISYLVLDANGLNLSDTSGTVGDMLARAKNSSSFSQSIGTTKKDWAKGLLQSVIRAGLDQPVDKKDKSNASK